MLLYNQRKEFVGIDADDLSSLGFSNINELLSESNDFADLFVKKPGYIHNFKNFSWIDFILHSETGESKAIIHAKGKNYSCLLHVASFHFVSEEGGFGVIVKNLRQLSGAEDAQASKSVKDSGGIQATPVAAPVATPAAITPTAMPEPEMPSLIEEPPAFEKQSLDISLEDMQLDEPYDHNYTPEPELPSFGEDLELSEPDLLDVPEAQDIDLGLATPEDDAYAPIEENEFGAPVDLGMPFDIEEDLDLTPDFDDAALDDAYPMPIEEEPVIADEAPMLGDYVTPTGATNSNHLSELVSSGTYQYNPQVAADELGLPVDLIEEFIGDFIDQAHEFHDDLFASVNSNDYDNVQILSHKLKGVAANLRVEDAFDTLSVVNVSKDNAEVMTNLNQFYKIIAKLEGKEIAEPASVAAPIPTPEPTIIEENVIGIEPQEQEHEIAIGLKQPDEGPMLIDEDIAPMSDDDLYDDLLATPEVTPTEPEVPSLDIEDDDLYGDLLAMPEPVVEDTPVTMIEEEEDDIYDDLLGAPEESFTEPEPEVAPTLEIPPLNFDAQRAANELGIPADIVNEFVQDFKEQVSSHQIDFNNAIAADDVAGVKKTATLLKGMSDNLRLNEISEVLKGLQQTTDTNTTAQDLATLQAYADQL